ncbi:FliA/WhiG family RNA polymerase sigma factor [Lederbergia graminis]|uniref:FliA/WhiG family RNA polymerase sigma factor n=1 Tax=Lederbergia graminis TaxID=735518 RepID=A0ABW0LH01_9BACI|nr:FliA/WhiG family RNA polymerase sigma factor [Bacillaceae bacterium]
MANSPPIEEQKQWERWVHSRDADAGNFLVERYMPLVLFHVQRISVGLPRNISREEIKSLGMVGLLDALHKYDYSRDIKFDTYASFRIKGAIMDGLRKEDWLPRNTREKVKKIDEVTNKLEQLLMRYPTPAEIAEETGLSEEEVSKTLNEDFFANILSIDEQSNDQDEDSHFFVLKDENTITPEAQIIKSEWLQELAEAVQELNEKEQLVLSLFYNEELTLTEIGEVMQLSTSRISQIHSKALVKIRAILLKRK